MMLTLLIGSGVIVLGAIAWFAANFFRTRRDFLNILRTARQHKAIASIDGMSVESLVERAHAGNGPAQYRLGYLYATGTGIARDFAKANYWLDRAARAGIVDAQYCIGLHHERGRGTPVNRALAKHFYVQAARAGSADAQCNLGVMMLHDDNGSEHVVDAALWLVRAAAQDNQEAKENLVWLIAEKNELSQTEREVIVEIERRAKAGDIDAMLLLGWMHAVGWQKPLDENMARHYYDRAEKCGHLFAHRLRDELRDRQERRDGQVETQKR